jgi:60 kDa SS-A/Ro ribonucleoprotein
MQRYHQHYQTVQTPQSQPIPGRETEMVENQAGGYVFPVDDWTRLDRFLVLGAEGNTYYATEHKMTVENAQAVARCIQADGIRAVNRIVEISEAGRAPKNDPALFALAMCAGMGNDATRKTALDALPRVARTGTHLFHFLEYVQGFRGWGRGLRKAVANWYQLKSIDDLAYQLVKYRQRDGWSHRDALRLSHPRVIGDAPLRNNLYKWATGKEIDFHTEAAPVLIEAFVEAQSATKKQDILDLIDSHGLTREMIPTQWLTEPEVWEALLEKMPMTAMIRNLATMTKIGLIAPMSDAARKVASELRDEHRIRRARVHPIQVLSALLTYQQGHGVRGRSTWQPVSQVVDALDDAFYISFGNVEPTGKRIVLALDVSGSMGSGMIAGVPGLTPRLGSCAMAMVTARCEPNHVIVAFSDKMVPVEISPRERLDDVVRKTSAIPFRGTDCALPMLWALGYNTKSGASYWNRTAEYIQERSKVIEADAFVTYCVDEDTEILTGSGWKRYDEVTIEDEVYTLDHKTGLAEWQRPDVINVFPKAKRELVFMKQRGHSSLTTKNHRWPVRRRGNSRWFREWKTTEELTTKDYIQCAARDRNLLTEPLYDDAFVELVAWCYTEGHWNASSAMTIAQSQDVNPDLCDRIRHTLMDIYGEPVDSMYERRFDGVPLWVEDKPRDNGTIYWRLNQVASRPLAEVVSPEDKSISLDWFRNLTLEQLNIFIEVSMLADGHFQRMRFGQVSMARAETFAFACILAGRPVSYCRVQNKFNNGYEIGVLHRTQVNPVSHARNSDGRPAEVITVQHDGIVWCPTTLNGTWLARRKGSVYWTGNTDSETWFGNIHPVQALQKYRKETGIPAKLVTVGMVSNGFSISDPKDGGCLDVVGFDTATPNLISDFIGS